MSGLRQPRHFSGCFITVSLFHLQQQQETNMTAYRYTFTKGQRVIDFTEEDSRDETPAETCSGSNTSQSDPTPSKSPEAAYAQPKADQTPDRPIKPLPRSHSTESTNRSIDPTIKTKVAVALLSEGRVNLNRARLCEQVSTQSRFSPCTNRIDRSIKATTLRFDQE